MYKLKVLLILITSLCCSYIYAKDLKVNVQLKKIVVEALSEKHGDELYFSVTKYSNKKESTQKRIPMFPTHWLSKNLDTIKNIKLWEDTIQKDEAVQLIISLIEHDSPPWDLDDHIGSVKVTLVNKKGKLKIDWSIPNLSDQTEVTKLKKNSPSFILKGDGGRYKVIFDVKYI